MTLHPLNKAHQGRRGRCRQKVDVSTKRDSLRYYVALGEFQYRFATLVARIMEHIHHCRAVNEPDVSAECIVVLDVRSRTGKDTLSVRCEVESNSSNNRLPPFLLKTEKASTDREAAVIKKHTGTFDLVEPTQCKYPTRRAALLNSMVLICNKPEI